LDRPDCCSISWMPLRSVAVGKVWHNYTRDEAEFLNSFLCCRWWRCPRGRYALAWCHRHGNFRPYGIHGCKSLNFVHPKINCLNNSFCTSSLAAWFHLIFIPELPKSW
jgi:hypothetical protein